RNVSNNSSFERKRLLSILAHYFEDLPWDHPQKDQLVQLDHETQYGAWAILNGYNVNHFTALVDQDGVPTLNDIEKVAAEMKKSGIPMKKEIEGERGSKLRQTSTESVVLETIVKDGSRKVRIPWSYAYFEIAERPLLKNPLTGQMERFEGFLGAQATHLFDMTALK
ncbi:MAG: DUF1338 family protein, partial [Elusimicrobia bacterium]|nr:DUF1338 family protein [Elusimicrobiota bacterium]